jgi:hypothetical protein
MRTEILSYSRSRGLFAGISLDGSTLRQDGSANRKFYGKDLTAWQIVREHAVGVPAAAQVLVATLDKQSPRNMSDPKSLGESSRKKKKSSEGAYADFVLPARARRSLAAARAWTDGSSCSGSAGSGAAAAACSCRRTCSTCSAMAHFSLSTPSPVTAEIGYSGSLTLRQ